MKKHIVFHAFLLVSLCFTNFTKFCYVFAMLCYVLLRFAMVLLWFCYVLICFAMFVFVGLMPKTLVGSLPGQV